MPAMPNDILSLFALAFAFGIKHGLDPDHLATIDGLARFNSNSKPWLSKWSGVLFSMGHGVVVTTVLTTVAFLPSQLSVPNWLEKFGSTVSIITLVILGVLNLHAAFNFKDPPTSPIGVKSWMRFQSGHPVIVLGIGALFALSFDTISQAAFFSLAATHISGEFYALALGIIFTCGMIVSDGLNGFITSRFIKQTSNRLMTASRIMSFTIGSVSMLVALLGIKHLFLPHLPFSIEQFGLWPGMAVFAWVAAGFILSLYFARSSALSRQNR